MKTIIIIQARMGSTRLPGKVLMPLGETVVLDYVVSRCRHMNVSDVIVATSTLAQDNPIALWCEKNDVLYFRGSEDNVLSRYYDCAKQYNPDYIIRVTADCPFVDYEMANEIIIQMEQEKVEIIDLQGELPRGLAVEMISFQALKRIFKISKEPRHYEHVTYYAYEYREQFTRITYKVKDQLCQSKLRITLDTEPDYELCKIISNHFVGDKFVSAQEVVHYLFENPEVAAINAHIEQKPVV